MPALKIWLNVIWHGRLIKPLGIIWILIGAYDLISSQFLGNKLLKISDLLPNWAWQYQVIIMLFLLLIITIEGIYKKESSRAQGNWIDDYKNHHGKLPPLPDYLLGVVNYYTSGQPISTRIQPN